MAADAPLPAFVPPMLARIGRPFDSQDHLYEIKWDGFRAQLRVGAEGHRLTSRRRTDFTPRYPELADLASLPAGLLLDGEIVVLRDGRPSFESLLHAEHGPVTYVVFDVMYRDHASVMDAPLVGRRRHLEEIVRDGALSRLVLSDGVVGGGAAFYEEACARGLEGVVAKDLSAPYEPGRRSGAWTKIKQARTVLCAILGYAADEGGDLKSLVVATNEAEGLRFVGKVGSGLTEPMRGKLRALCDERRAEAPLVPCELDARWVAPGLYCKVRYAERTSAGMLRAPVFRELIE